MAGQVYIVQNWEAESAGTIADYLDENKIAHKTVRAYAGEPLPPVSDCRAAIILGTPISLTNYQEHEFLRRVHAFGTQLVESDVPTLGICYGAQMMASILGAEVKRNPVREIGLYTARLTDDAGRDPLFAGFDREFDVFHWHGDTFAIPPGASLLAEGDNCRNQAFRKGSVVGVQFHLEPRTDEIPLWCDVYQDELAAEEKTKIQIIDEFNSHAEQIRALNYLLLRNFLS